MWQNRTLPSVRFLDLVFIANLVVMLIGASVELFIPRPPAVEHGTSDGLGIVDFADLKLKVFASISVIAAIDLLESFISLDRADKPVVFWKIVILLAFVLSGVLLAGMDKLSEGRH
jgi:uncharacterized protein (TIGR00645 family)